MISMSTAAQPAKRHGLPERSANAETFVTFELGRQIFGVGVTHVREILDRQTVSLLPNAPADCIGVIDTRGASIPMIDLARRLGLVAAEAGNDTRIIVFELDGETSTEAVGIVAERVLDVTRIAADAVEPAPQAARSPGNGQVEGLARLDGQLVVLLDIASLLGRHGQDL